MPKTAEEAVVRKNVRVNAPIEQAFSIFVEQMETWWPAEHHIGGKPFESIIVEPRVGGRWYERDAEGTDCEWGTVRAWDPPRLVTFSWHLGPDWKYTADLAKSSDVAIRFTSEGPEATLVELEHTGIERHGEGYEQLRAALDSPNAWERTLAEFATAAARGVRQPWPAVWLKVASVLTFIHALLHTVGGVFGKVDAGAEQTAVDAMKGNAFVAMGATRTMWDFFHGMGLAVSVLLTLAAVVLWQLSVLAKTEMLAFLRPVFGAFVVGFLLMAVVSWQYFFVAPVVTEVLIAACLGIAMIPARQVERRAQAL